MRPTKNSGPNDGLVSTLERSLVSQDPQPQQQQSQQGAPNPPYRQSQPQFQDHTDAQLQRQQSANDESSTEAMTVPSTAVGPVMALATTKSKTVSSSLETTDTTKKKKNGSSKSSKAATGSSLKSSSSSSKKRSPSTRTVKAKKVRRLFESVAQQLSEISRLIEGWDQPEVDDSAAAGKQAVTKKLKKHMKKSTVALGKLKQSLPACQEYQKINIPASLIAHVDDGNSPGTWIKRLVERCKTESEVAHGELYAITNFRGALLSKLQEMSAVTFPESEEFRNIQPAQ